MAKTGRARDDGSRRPASSRGATRTARRLYESLFSEDERAALKEAVEGNDLQQEVELLRVLIRRGVAEGLDLETLSRALGRLAQLLRVQHVIAGQAAQSLDEALAKALEEIANEVGL
jgi:hypothetical protein